MSKIKNTHREIKKQKLGQAGKVDRQGPSRLLNCDVYCIDFLKDSQQLHLQLALINRQLDTSSSFQEINQLSLQLDQASSTLRTLKRETKRLSPQSDYFLDIENKIINTYGLIENAQIKRQFAEIQGAASLLKTAIALKQPHDHLRVALKELIDKLLQNYRPGIDERRILSDIKKIIDPEKNQQTPCPNPIYPQDPINEECEDLFDIAALLYDRNLRSAKARYHQLSEETKTTFKSHIKLLLATPFIDLIETMQALLATMNDMAGNGESYPSPSEMDEIFLGLRQVNLDKGQCLFHDIKTATYNHQLSG